MLCHNTGFIFKSGMETYIHRHTHEFGSHVEYSELMGEMEKLSFFFNIKNLFQNDLERQSPAENASQALAMPSTPAPPSMSQALFVCAYACFS